MKFLLSSLLLLGLKSAVGQDAECAAEDQNDCPVPEYTKCPPGVSYCEDPGRRLKAKKTDNARKLAYGFPDKAQQEYDDDEPLPYGLPCYNPSRNDLNDATKNWSKWNLADDNSQVINLNFQFDFFNKQYDQLWLADNGFITFENTFQNNYQPSSFPSGLSTPMIAPFWADVQTEGQPGGRGNIFYQDFGNHFVVIWDMVGHYTDSYSEASTAHNSFQVVLSKSDPTNNRNPELDNICFCYLDMGWTHGDRDGDGSGFEPSPRDPSDQTRSATVGITNGLSDPYGLYAQIGRYNTTGYANNGILIPSGVDFLDNKGSITNLNSRAAFCFNAGPNLPPIFQAGPMDGMITIPCGGNLPEYKVYFATPETGQLLIGQEIVEVPDPAPEGLSLTVDNVNEMGYLLDGSTLGFRFEWLDPDFSIYGGQTFEFKVKVCDNHEFSLCTTESVTITVGSCGGGESCVPDKCTILTDTSTCTSDVKAICTPWRSPEHCDPMVSFPTLISTRYQMIKESTHGTTDELGQLGWWFHYTDDRAGAYSFTTDCGYAAPELYCCVAGVDELLGAYGDTSSSECFGGSGPSWTGSYVIRAEGHHSGTGVFVLPAGLDYIGGGSTTELATGAGSVTMAAVRNYLNTLSPTPKKILVEKFISAGPIPTLPTEYKFHMFNGKIGSISAFFNRGTDCACYGEYSEDWECLHKNGCFVPNMPMGQVNPANNQCYDIDFTTGEKNPYPCKGFDLCGPVPKPRDCVFTRMKEIAEDLSKKIGVYVRIDMFVTDSGEIYVQEYTYNHLGGTRHCASKVSDAGCLDSCFLGQCWQEASVGLGSDPGMGGVLTGAPPVFTNAYGDYSNSGQCSTATAMTAVAATTTC